MEQSELMRLIVQTLELLKIPYMITGSHASAYYGEPRFTRDIDIVAELKEGQVDTTFGINRYLECRTKTAYRETLITS